MIWGPDIDDETRFLRIFGMCVVVILARNDQAKAAFDRVLPRSATGLYGTEQQSRSDGNEPEMHNSDKDQAA